ncbi:mercuric reductase [Pontibacter oryzae]|uniref:Mercuric reductase n=1 Tax=Pontibacter oryzae TaxID=2304593 RepID=A0A399SJE4_9BACT|nr:mercuric reductase [Pontibacter oryzae]RIJ43029.1 mercuric reductase [Pontibacter oryzae]
MENTQEHFSAIIIGTGQAGTPLAKALAKTGQQVAIIEASYVGGSCINYGCTPTKTLLASAKAAHTARQSADFGVHTGKISVEMQEVKARRDKVVQQFREGTEAGLDVENLTFIAGKAVFQNAHTLQVNLNDGGTRTITGDKIFVNTGAIPNIPPLDGLDKIDYLTHISIQELTEVPEHLVILGGGYVGLEFGQMYRRFGSQVTIVQRGEQLLEREDEDVAQCLQHILEDEGIRVLLQTEAQCINKTNGQLQLDVKLQNGQTETIGASHLLIATGVKAATENLGLDKAGVETDEKGNIETNASLQTSVPHIYALGDVKGGPQFTHISFDDYRILRDNLLHNGQRTTTDRQVPYCVFTDPQLGRIGLTEKEAKEKGIPYKVATLPMEKIARGIETGQTKGFYKALVHPETKVILGAAILAPEGGEVMTMLEIAMMGNLKYTQLKQGVFAHPTYGESLNNLFMKLED